MKSTRNVLAAAAVFAAVSLWSSAPGRTDDKPTLMKAAVYHEYGGPEVVRIEDIPRPVPAADEVLVRVHAASVNPLDWHYMRGLPYLVRLGGGLRRPKDTRLGVDFAGTVEAVGKDVKRFKPGDEVFGGKGGAFGEYVSVHEGRAIALKPANVTFEQAASIPIAAITALQALRDKGQLRAGQKVLINGASGGVGTFAVQIAKSFGAEVTAVCSTRNLAMVRSIGADHVIDYTHDDFTAAGQRYELILDNVGTHSLSDYRRALTPKGALVIVGGTGSGDWLGPLAGPAKAFFVAPFVSQKLTMIMAELNGGDLAVLGKLMEAGKLTPVIDRRYPLSELPAALGYVEQGHARGKVVIQMDPLRG